MMKKSLKYIFVSLLLWTSVSMAEEGAITLGSAVDKSKVTIGDLITYTVTVTHDSDVKLEWPGLGANLGGFDIRDYKAYDPVKEKGKIVSKVDYTIATFFVGEFYIPPLQIGYMLPGDSTLNVIATDKIKITVESMKASEAGDIRDVKPPKEIAWNWWEAFRLYIFLFIFLLILLAGWIGYRRYKAGQPILPMKAAPPRPPHEIALEKLEQLKASDLLEKGEIKQYYIELSDIVRQYLEGRYFITALEMTTEEALDNLKAAQVEGEVFTEIGDFLRKCDLVKFAKHRPEAKVTNSTWEMAYHIVDSTKIVLEPAESEITSAEVSPSAQTEIPLTTETEAKEGA